MKLLAALLAFAALPAVAFQKDIPVHALPDEARATLVLIKKNGPFPYSQDGKTFGNRESRLPKRAYGYYREFTVKTPGARDRGGRRIVAGQPGEYYYSPDHYRSFRRIVEP